MSHVCDHWGILRLIAHGDQLLSDVVIVENPIILLQKIQSNALFHLCYPKECENIKSFLEIVGVKSSGTLFISARDLGRLMRAVVVDVVIVVDMISMAFAIGEQCRCYVESMC